MSKNRIIWKIVLGATNILEKARWLLDISPLRYEEDRHLPPFHLARTTSEAIAKLRRIQMPDIIVDDEDKHIRRKEKTAVPKLVLPASLLPSDLAAQLPSNEKQCIIKDGSKGISRFLIHSFPEEMGYLVPTSLCTEVYAVEEYLERVLAPAATAFAFGNFLLCDRDSFADENIVSKQLFISSCLQTEKISGVQRFLFKRFGSSIIAPAMIQGNGVSAVETARARKDIVAAFEYVEAVRKRNGCSSESDHMFNTEKPTLADISFAAFSAPLLLPPETSYLFFDRQSMQHVPAPGCMQYLEMTDFLLNKYESARAVMRMYTRRH